jgi:hypothetical protein
MDESCGSGAREVDRLGRARVGSIGGTVREFDQARVSLVGRAQERMMVGWHPWLGRLGGWLV